MEITIEILPGRYFIGVWYLSASPMLTRCDWLATAFRDAGQEVWRVRYRFKYYNSPDPFDGLDKRSAYSGTLTGTEQQLIEKLGKVAEAMASTFKFEKDFLLLGTDDPKEILTKLAARPWTHMKMERL